MQLQKDRIEGKAPSIAENQLKQATQQNISQQSSAAASAGGGAFGESSANRTAMANSAQAQQQSAGQAATLRAQEQAQAEAAYAEQANAMRSQAQAQQQLEQSQQLGVGDQYASSQEAYKGRKNGSGAAMVGTAASLMAMMSDRRAKTDVKRMSDNDIEQFLEDSTAYWYHYKNDPSTQHAGVMAQDMPHDVVREDQDGMKRIDLDSAYTMALGALGNLNDRLQRLERK